MNKDCPKDSDLARIVWELHRQIEKSYAEIEQAWVTRVEDDCADLVAGALFVLARLRGSIEVRIPALRGFQHGSKG